MIHDHLEYPSKAQWIEIEKKSKIAQLHLDVKKLKTSDIFAFITNEELSSWIRLFNNRLGQSRMSYIFFMHYYNKGIPDDEWFIVKDQSIQYFPHFNKETFYYKSIFDYYIDNFYYKFFSAWDTMYHIINVYYQFNIETGNRFNSNVMKNLLKIDNNLYKVVEQTNKSEPFTLSRTLRNDITHNFAPNDISSGVIKENEEFKNNMSIMKVSFGVGHYTHASVFTNNINGIIENFLPLLQELKNKLES
ncbi:Cthe_2314 family HEPN domain-containing protein [Paenibacillus sp. N3.4]|uniref:Cthe_2314 family HEPN domain-containing protein n=1 Tax=Paenibacillus sp. N3.4 TaxID=2603222 RepID=UPI0011CC7835|nr:Cthe_2314 family HEPN domain-containing protein [Paenibacillus sp. N3.4]TXK77714.1 hypothetical protein FU659_21780 [Paenibacillus sp. N3.4]